MIEPENDQDGPHITPEGKLLHLEIEDLQPSPHNPRRLFDEAPLAALKESIRQHGVLVPLTVYQLPGQNKYRIVDGERRYRCCADLSRAGFPIKVPVNIVAPPEPRATLIYMFNIHQFREQWELMPTAIALKTLIDDLGTDSNEELMELTGLSQPQLDRCKIILEFPEKYRKMSMEADSKERMPSNFWVELYPVLQLSEKLLPELIAEVGRDGITDRMVDKYHAQKIKSVIHFRRILEAYEIHKDNESAEEVADRLREYILTPELETRSAFDGFILDTKRVQGAVDAIDKFVKAIERAKIEYETDQKDALIIKLTGVLIIVQNLLAKLEGEDPPDEDDI